MYKSNSRTFSWVESIVQSENWWLLVYSTEDPRFCKMNMEKVFEDTSILVEIS